MGANEAKYNINGNINIKVALNKVCYFPGENMTGKIQLIPNPGYFQECKKFSEIINYKIFFLLYKIIID